jgi:hypothetical protein
MIKVDGVKGQTFGISFTHEKLIGYNENGEKIAYPHGTICTIHLLDRNGQSLARWEGHAYCHSNDQFKKETGRKIALTRALYGLASQCSLTKHDRALFWDAYFDRKNPARKVVAVPAGEASGDPPYAATLGYS